MAYEKEHANDCELILGKRYEKIHAWLDEYAKKYPPEEFDSYHRKFRHNLKGVLDIREKYGDEAALAACIHIFRDLKIMGDKKDG